MNTTMKRMLSLVLCLVMLVGVVPVNAFAKGGKHNGHDGHKDEIPVETVAVETTQATVPETTEVIVPGTTAATVPEETVATVPETTEAAVTETTEATVPETTEATVPETTEETEPAETTVESQPALMMMAAAPRTVSAYTAPEGYEVVDAAVIFTDLHTSSSDYKQDEVEAVMTALKGTGLPISSVTSGGDAFSVNEDSSRSNGPYTGYTGTITGYIQGILPGVPVNYLWSDHDRCAVQADGSTLLDKTSRVVFNNDNYYVYALSMGDLCSYDRYEAGFNYTETDNSGRKAAGFTPTVAEAIANFKTAAAQMDKNRPLLIVSHQPLFDNRNDNAWAEAWFDAINEVAAERDVFFFYGHNHKYNDASGADYYYDKGATMPVATADNWNWDYDIGEGYLPSMDLTSESKVLNFTHLCGGYLEPTSTSSSSQGSNTRVGTLVVAVLCENDAGEQIVNLVTYDANGEYTGDYAVNEVVECEFDKVETQPETPEENEPVADTNGTGITVAAPGATTVTAVVNTDSEVVQDAVRDLLTNFVSYDITIDAELAEGDTAVVALPLPGDVTNPAVYYVAADGETENMTVLGVENGMVSFETSHFSTYVIGEAKVGNTSDVVTPGGTTKVAEEVVVYKLVDELKSNKQYLIVNSNTGDGYGLDGDTTGYETTKFTGGNDYYSTWDDSTKTGTAFAAGSDVYLTTGGAYLWTAGDNTFTIGYTREDEGGMSGMFGGSYTYTLNPSGNGNAWTVLNKQIKINLQATYEGSIYGGNISYADYYLSNSNAKWSMGDTATDLYFYEPVTIFKVTETTTDSSTVTYGINITVDNQATGTLTVNGVTANETKQLGYAFYSTPAGYEPSGGTLTWSKTTDNGIADVDADGKVTFTGVIGTETILVSYTWKGADNKNHTISNTLVITTTAAGSGGDSGEGGDTEADGPVNNYPEYPHEGAVKVSKTATGIDFQSSGIAQVEVSASGVPIKKGADVIVMLDTSSSMYKNCIEGDYNSNGVTCHDSRAEVLEASLANLIKFFKTPGADGELLDLKVAIADFNGYYGHNSGGTSGTPYDRTSGDYVKNGNSNGSGYSQPSEARVYTGDGLNAGAFLPVEELAATYTLNYTSGTNYDYAFDAIYQLGAAIKAENKKNEEERDLYVIFMSDGAALQWNYFGTQNGYTKWNQWLTGAWKATDLTTTNLNSTTHSYFYDLNDHDSDGHINEHRMANAIKGKPTQQYEIIRKSTAGLPEGTLTSTDKDYLYTVPGLGATMFTINFAASQDGQITEASIDKALASTASDQTGSTQYYYKVTTAAQLQHAFDTIGAEIAYAAYNARFVDQMGGNYNLQMAVSNYSVVDGTTTTGKTITPKIEIISYDIYTKAEADAGTIPPGKNVGDRKGTFTVLETVTFNAGGTEAYSDKKTGNILVDGVICAQTFWYNTNPTPVAIDGVFIPTGILGDNTTTGSTNMLPAETFYWKTGTVQTSELAMRYYVYLDGSMEGTKEGGSYATNEFATLYYDNYLGNACYKDTVSPVMAWKEANVSYAFYLVDENGKIVVNQTTGQTGSFANKIAVTNPVVYRTVLLNNEGSVQAIKVTDVENTILPLGYELYDSRAEYEVTINSNTTGSWKITNGGTSVNSTYVTQYKTDDASAYSNALKNETVGDDYTHTVVWFAVQWKVQALPDSVVVDYGLPVDISVLGNDMFGTDGKLAGVGAYTSGIENTTAGATLATGFGTSYTGKYGTAKVEASIGKVRYTLNTMSMNGYEKFAYAVKYEKTGTNVDADKNGYYYDTVTVIPATTIYYEDNFLTCTASGTAWTDEGTAVTGAMQAEDRPGQYSLTDANNIYGYDGVNLAMSKYSLGTAKKVHVGPLADGSASYANAEFTFFGTGFDIISMTSNTTGMLAIKVTAAEDIVVDGATKYAKDATVKSTIVDTYYGYNYGLYKVTYTYSDATKTWTESVGDEITDDGATEQKKEVPKDPANGATYTNQEYRWVSQPDVNKAIYQVPVLQANDLPYGKYKATLIATYMASMDDTSPEGYDLYLDAIRIYDPANDGASDDTTDTTDTTIEDAYKADGEGWPSYIELRNKIIAASSFDNVANDKLTEDIEGLVFIDGKDSVGDAEISDYVSYGPNNEVYLAPGQCVAFQLTNPGNNVVKVHIGIKSADGNTATYSVCNIAATDRTVENKTIAGGTQYGEKFSTVNTTTDMYYDLTGWKNDIILISNTGSSGIISLTNIKSTYTSNPNSTVTQSEDDSEGQTENGVSTASVVSAEVPAATGETEVYMTPSAAKLTLRSLNRAAVVEPEETAPEESVPETTVPEESTPETSVPETTVPGETEPETTVPETTVPDEGEDHREQVEEAIKQVVETVAQVVKNTLKNLFNKWFR